MKRPTYLGNGRRIGGLGALLTLLACRTDDDQERASFEETFPERYCAWLEACPVQDGQDYGLDGDCVGYYTRVMEAERENHECFDVRDSERCLDALDPGSETYESCESLNMPQHLRGRPPHCWEVTWAAPCNDGTDEGS